MQCVQSTKAKSDSCRIALWVVPLIEQAAAMNSDVRRRSKAYKLICRRLVRSGLLAPVRTRNLNFFLKSIKMGCQPLTDTMPDILGVIAQGSRDHNGIECKWLSEGKKFFDANSNVCTKTFSCV